MSEPNPPGEIKSIDYRSREFNQPQPIHDESQLNRLAISQVYNHQCSLEQELAALKQANIQTVGLYRPRLAEFCDQQNLGLLLQFQMQVSSIAWAGGFTGSHGYSHDEAIADSCDVVQLASAAGASCVLVATGARYGHTRNHTNRLICDGLKQVSDFAGERNIELAVVPMVNSKAGRWTCLNSIDDAMQIILKCNRPNIGLGIDAGQLQNSEILLGHAESVAPHTKLVRMQVVCDADSSELVSPSSSDEDSSLPLEEILNQYTQHGYDGFFEFQLNTTNQWSLKEYREMLSGCRELFAQSVLI
ncbi:sugar phosphate isomerase/epimerase family protein [Polystyrenella longa]|uniref:sugar phosphate isomerase/epimerase family protein n=1 Tax=Polystyrenella longa TaxID=2528007 RepID=UPI0011A1C647|nr:TIM barrel protein [Polystyrenella longa]